LIVDLELEVLHATISQESWEQRLQAGGNGVLFFVQHQLVIILQSCRCLRAECMAMHLEVGKVAIEGVISKG